MSGVDDADRARKRRGRWFVGLPATALGCVLLALAAGASRAHWLPVSAFLTVTVAATGYLWIGNRVLRRRALRLRRAELPWGVRHTQPLWIMPMNALLALGAGALLGAIVAAFGFPSVGVGALLVFGILAAGGLYGQFGMSPRGLTFEAGGLRVHIRGASFVIPWTALGNVEVIGPDHSQMMQVHLNDVDVVIASHEPKTPRGRERVESFLHRRAGGGARMMLMPWTAGLDGQTIARTIQAAARGKADPAN